MLTLRQLQEHFDQTTVIYELTNDALVYLEYIFRLLSNKPVTQLLEICQRNDYEIKEEGFYETLVKDLYETTIDIRDYRGDNFINTYDLVVTIGYTECFYDLFKDFIPVFPYQPQSIFTHAINLSFGDPNELPPGFVTPLIDYLRSSLAIAQNTSLEEFRKQVNQKAQVIYKSPLNLLGEFCTLQCERILDLFVQEYGPHWKEHLNFINLINVLQKN